MIIKKYKANTVEEAQKKIEEDLGPDAIILTSRLLKEKGIKGLFSTEQVEVTAAIEESDLESYEQAKPTPEVTSQVSKKTMPKKAGPSAVTKEGLNENLGQLKELMSKFTQGSEEATSQSSATTGQSAAPFSAPKELKTEGATLSLSQNVVSTPAPNVSSSGPDQVEMSQATSTKSSGTYSPFGKVGNKVPAQREVGSVSMSGSEVSSQANSQGRVKSSPQFSQAQQMQQLGERLLSKIQAEHTPVTSSSQQVMASPVSKMQPKSTSTKSMMPEDSVKPSSNPVDLNAIRDIIREEMKQAQYGIKKEVEKQSKKSQSEPHHADMKFLVSKGVSRNIAWEVEEEVNRQVSIEDFAKDSEERTQHLNLLKDELAKRINVGGPIELRPEKTTYVALVGSTGVGKTTTLAKLASLYAHVFGKKVAIVNLDHDKFGKAPITSFAKEQQIEYFDVTEVKEVEAIKPKLDEFELVLVDTSGRNQYLHQEVKDLAEVIEKWGEIQLYLTLSANTKDVDNYGIIQSFSTFNLEGLIFTKLDETISWGSLVNISGRTKKPICYLSMGKRVPEDLVLADQQKIAKNILLQHNDESFQVLQRIANS